MLSWSPSWVTARRRWSIEDLGSTHSQEVEVELYKELYKEEEGKEEVDKEEEGKVELQRERECGTIPTGTTTT